MSRALRSLLLLVTSTVACGPRQQVGSIESLKLVSGEVIEDCRIGYRTFGQLNADRSNVVVVLPWYEATSADMAPQIGPGKLVDSSKYFVVIIDGLGNGVSTSPSNSTRQPGTRFPRFTIRDMVESQRRLLTETLGVSHVKAIVGISMGGMQVFEWMTAHPDFMDKAVPIVGSPQAQPDDRARWEEIIRTVHRASSWKRSWTEARQFRPRAALAELGVDADDHTSQARAAMALDVAASFGGSMAEAARAVRASLLVVGTSGDREVNPAPGFEFARLTGAEVLELDGRCGHQAPSCERAVMWPRIAAFLDRPVGATGLRR